MRTSALQHLYLQKPVTTVVLVALLSVLPCITTGDFATKGEPREAAVAVSMINSGDWILPTVYADEIAYKPPMMHWLMVIGSKVQGYVTPFTARLPSAIAYTALIAITLLFFGHKIRFQEAFIATLLLFTCIEIHRAGLTARVDMLLTVFTVGALMELFRWEDKFELKGLPILIPILISCAVLTKGPVGLVVPLGTFGVYLLLLKKYSKGRIAKSIVYAALPAMLVPSLWYIEAAIRGGEEFIHLIVNENIGRFFHLPNGHTHYELGHENGAWYNIVTLLAGWMPWTLLLAYSIVGLKFKITGKIGSWVRNAWNSLLQMEKIRLFSLTAAVCIVVFYSIPSSKRSVYLMPAYPFIALFVAQYLLYIAEHRAKVIRWFSGTVTLIVGGAVTVAALSMAGVLHINNIAAKFDLNSTTLDAIDKAFVLSPLTIASLALLTTAAVIAVYQMNKKINIKILYATVFLVFTTNFFVDAVVMKSVKNETSTKQFATELQHTFKLNENQIFVMNDLKNYGNLYGLNFYLGNRFTNFEKAQPDNGLFLSTDRDFPKIKARFENQYIFNILKTSDKKFGDTGTKIILSQFTQQQPK